MAEEEEEEEEGEGKEAEEEEAGEEGADREMAFSSGCFLSALAAVSRLGAAAMRAERA